MEMRGKNKQVHACEKEGRSTYFSLHTDSTNTSDQPEKIHA